MQKLSNNKQFSKLLMDKSQIDISIYEPAFLNKSLKSRMTDTYCSNELDYMLFVERNPGEGGNLGSTLNISYSEFFRNSLTFSILEKIILPGLHLQNIKGREIRVWSAACASGQEAYSLAMLFEEFNDLSGEKLKYRIFATDKSEDQVMLAQKGLFGEAALKNVNLKRLSRWFSKKGENYFVKPELKNHIDFSVFDLFCEEAICPPASIFGGFDIVFCSNVLFYYNKESRSRIITKAGHCLNPAGYFITGETEREILQVNGYDEAFPFSAIFQQNTGSPPFQKNKKFEN